MVSERVASASLQFALGTVVVVLLDALVFGGSVASALVLGIPTGVGIAISRYLFWPANEEV